MPTRRNPLESFARDTPAKPRDEIPQLAPLLSPKTVEVFKQAYRNVPFQIQLVVSERGTNAMGRHPPKMGMLNLYLLTDADGFNNRIQPGTERTARYLTVFTPFTVLHRAWDEMDDLVERDRTITRALDRKINALSGNVESVASKLNSFGVDTEAGRRGLLGDTVQVEADLFAKWALTGRICYDPYAVPEPYRKDKAFIRLREAFSKSLLPNFESVLNETMSGPFGVSLFD